VKNKKEISNSQKYLPIVAVIVMTITAMLSVSYYILGLYSAAIIDAIGILGAILMFPIMKYISYKVAAHWSLFLTYIILMGISLLANPHAIWWLVMIPMIAVVFLDKRCAILWSVCIFTTVMSLGFYFGFNDIMFKLSLPEGPFAFLSLITFILALSTIAIAIAKTRENDTNEQIYSAKLASLGQMSGEIAHHINSPLTVILGSIKVIERFLQKNEIKDEQVIRRLSSISNQAKNVAKLIKSMKEMTHNGQKDIAEAVTLNMLFKKVIKCSELRLKESQILFSYAMNRTYFVKVQSGLISDVLLSLLNNSIDSLELLPETEKRILRIQLAEKQSGFVDINIIDTGVGISSSIRDQIFQPFFTTKIAGKRAGLGLSLAANYVKRNGGKLFLNEKHKDTCFTIRLPLYKEKRWHQKMPFNLFK